MCFAWQVEGFGTPFPVAFDPPFKGLFLDAERPCYLRLSDAAIDVKLTSDRAE